MANLLPPAAFLAKVGSFKTPRDGLVSPEAFKQARTDGNTSVDQVKLSTPSARKRVGDPLRRRQRISSRDENTEYDTDRSEAQEDVGMLRLIKSEINQLKEMQLKGIESRSKENTPPVSASQSAPAYIQASPHVANKYLDELIDRQNNEILQLKHQIKEFEMKQSLYERKNRESEETIKIKHQRDLNSKDADISRLSDELNSMKIQLSREKTTQQTVYEDNTQLQHHVSSLERTISEKTESLSKLKTYLQELQSNQTADQLWITDKQKLQSQLNQISKERDSFRSDCNLLNERIEHMEKILSIQEQSLTENGEEATSAGKNGQQNLLTRWRRKVYEMLVQQKSVEISYKNELSSWNKLKRELNNKISNQTSEINELKSKLQDKQCQIQLGNNHVQNLESQLSESQSELERCNTANEQMMRDREQILLNTQHTQKTMDAEMERLDELYTKKMSALESRIICTTKLLPKLTDSMRELKSEKCNLELQLEIVTDERAQLELNLRRVSNQQELANQRCVELEEVVSSLNVKYTDSDTRCDRLLTELRTYRDNIDLEKTRIELNAEREFINKLKTAEDNIIELKRQLAKNVVEMRSLERDNSRLKSQHAQDKQLTVEKYKQRCDRLDLENKNLLTEQNILQTNLRYANQKPTQSPTRHTRIHPGDAIQHCPFEVSSSAPMHGDMDHSETGSGDNLDCEVVHELTIDELNQRQSVSQRDEIESLKNLAQSLLDQPDAE